MSNAPDLLRKGLEEIGIPYSAAQINSFLVYLSELRKWNKAYNLTGLKTEHEIIVKHFLDSLLFLTVMPESAKSAADVGSGAGFPGIPIKIIRPALRMVLIEPTQKKNLFLRHMSATLGLEHVDVIGKRLEEIDGLHVDVAMTRALFTVREFMEKAKKLVHAGGLLIMNKGPKLSDELRGLNSTNIAVIDKKLPVQNSLRHLVVVTC